MVLFMMNLGFVFLSISVVIIGGDGSVINVINALIRYLANENRTRWNWMITIILFFVKYRLDMENDLSLCIISDGKTI